MKTDSTQLRTLAARVQELPGDCEVSLPASFVAGMVADLKEAADAHAALEQYRAKIDGWFKRREDRERPRLVLVQGGEEDVG